MKKQTAVEWLVNELETHHVFHDIKNTNAYQIAKAMEREQIVKAWEYGCMTNYGDAQTYYNETYGDPQYCELTWKELDELCEQAKQMEKEQTCTSNQVPFYETCYCNPKNGGSGICGCTISNKIVYGK